MTATIGAIPCPKRSFSNSPIGMSIWSSSRESNAKYWHCRAAIGCNIATSDGSPRGQTFSPDAEDTQRLVCERLSGQIRNCQLHCGLETQGCSEGRAGDGCSAGRPYSHPLIEAPTKVGFQKAVSPHFVWKEAMKMFVRFSIFNKNHVTFRTHFY